MFYKRRKVARVKKCKKNTGKQMLLCLFVLSLLSATVAIADSKGEWVTCPTRTMGGVNKTHAFWDKKKKKLKCMYYRPTGEYKSLKYIGSKSGKPFKSCLRKNVSYKRGHKDFYARYPSESYCSFTKSQEELVKSAYAWSASSKYKKERIRMGNWWNSPKRKRENFFICRVKYKGKRYVGRVWRERCYIPYKKGEKRLDKGFEYLILTKEYGVPMYSSPDSRKLITNKSFSRKSHVYHPAVNKEAPLPFQLHFCLICDKKTKIQYPGTLLPGNLCVASSKGKRIFENKNEHLLFLH